jgi:hypothetical protein
MLPAILFSAIMKFHMVLICHFHIECWQIGDNQYNCDGGRM